MHTREAAHTHSPVHAACLPKADLQSVRQRVLSIDMEHVCVHWGFNVGLALVYKSHFMLQYSRHGAAKELMCRTGHYQATLRPTTLGTQA